MLVSKEYKQEGTEKREWNYWKTAVCQTLLGILYIASHFILKKPYKVSVVVVAVIVVIKYLFSTYYVLAIILSTSHIWTHLIFIAL